MKKIKLIFFGGEGISTGATGHFVLALSAVTFFLWLGASAILPMLPLYLSSSGTGSFGVGMVMASYYIGAVATQIPVGKLVDSIGAKPIVVMGLLLFGLASLSFAITHGLFLAVIFRAIQGIGAGAVTVAAITAVSVSVEKGKKGASLGMIYGSQMMALALGPVIGSLLGSTSLRLLFVTAGFLGIMTGAVSGLYFLRSKDADRLSSFPEPLAADTYLSIGPDIKSNNISIEKLYERKGIDQLEKNLPQSQAEAFFVGMVRKRFSFVDKKSYPKFIAALLAFGVFGYMTGSYEATWALYLHIRHASSLEVGLSWTLFALPYAILSIPAGHLAERLNTKWIMFIALIWSGSFAALYPEIHNVVLIVGLAVAEATGAVIGSPAATLLISQSADASVQGRAQGMAETMRTLFAGLGALLAGSLFSISYVLPFLVLAFIFLVIAAAQIYLL